MGPALIVDRGATTPTRFSWARRTWRSPVPAGAIRAPTQADGLIFRAYFQYITARQGSTVCAKRRLGLAQAL